MVTYTGINVDGKGLFGNKLFRIAALIALAKRNRDEVILPGHPTWQYGHCFEHSIKTMLKLPPVEYIWEEPSFQYNEIKYQPNMDISGYFQSEKYFIDAIDDVRYYLEPKTEILNTLKNKYPMIWNEECISVHVRRGDYLLYPTIHPACSSQYYINAMEILPKADKYIIFSDDIEWCKQTFISDNDDVVFVEGQKNYEDMFLMSYCKHNITSNSSFSWWSSWLNKNKDKQIIMPKNWFGPDISPQFRDWSDIYPSGKVTII